MVGQRFLVPRVGVRILSPEPMSVQAIVLAAGEGTRMKSSRPKPLHLICGRAMVLHVIHALEAVHPEHDPPHGRDALAKLVRLARDTPCGAIEHVGVPVPGRVQHEHLLPGLDGLPAQHGVPGGGAR